MSNLIKFKDMRPKIDTSAFIADGAVIAADVTVGANSGIWFNSVVRGDVSPVTIGKNTNIQDGSVIHTSRFDGPTHIGDNITVGHMALIHACTLEDNCFVGMGSIIMDKAVVEEWGFIAAGSLVTPGKVIRKYELWAGRPAKFVRKITDDEIDYMMGNVQNYVELAKEYK